MKKISLFLCTLCLSVALFAQNASVGIKGGLNISNLHNSGADMGSKVGAHAGLLAHIHLSPQVALQPEVLYSIQGAKYTTNDGAEHKLSLNYINIPLQLQYMFDNGFRLQTGPQVGFLAEVKDKVGDNETGFFTSQDFKTVDFSWTAGLGYLSYSGLGVDGRYNFGLSNINNGGGNEIKNNVFQLGIFYMFNNNHKAASARRHY